MAQFDHEKLKVYQEAFLFVSWTPLECAGSTALSLRGGLTPRRFAHWELLQRIHP